MSKSADLNAKIKFTFEVDAGSGVSQIETVNAALGNQIVVMGDLIIVQQKAASSGRKFGSGVRGTLMSLRMFSFAVRTLRRELGDTNPIIEGISTGLILVSSTLTGLTAAGDLANKATKALGGGMAGLSASVTSLSTTLVTLAPVIAVILATFILLSRVAMWFDMATGIDVVRRASKALSLDIKTLKNDIEVLNREQDAFNIGMSETALQMRKLKQAIDLQQSGTEALEDQLGVLAAEYENAGIKADEMGLSLKRQTLLEKELTEAQNESARIMAAKRKAGANPFISEEAALLAYQNIGWKPGDPNPSPDAFARGKEQSSYGATQAQRAEIVFNFPNAVFNNVADVITTLEASLRNPMAVLFNQYANPGRQR